MKKDEMETPSNLPRHMKETIDNIRSYYYGRGGNGVTKLSTSINRDIREYLEQSGYKEETRTEWTRKEQS